MLLSDEIRALAEEFADEAQHRPEFSRVVPAGLASDDNFWAMVFDLMEHTIHRKGYVLVKQADYMGQARRKDDKKIAY